jgi:hypothetical protein
MQLQAEGHNGQCSGQKIEPLTRGETAILSIEESEPPAACLIGACVSMSNVAPNGDSCTVPAVWQRGCVRSAATPAQPTDSLGVIVTALHREARCLRSRRLELQGFCR